MAVEVFEPQVDNEHRFAVAVPTDSHMLAIIQTYGTLEQLESGYIGWKERASQRGITPPLPITRSGEKGMYQILTDLFEN